MFYMSLFIVHASFLLHVFFLPTITLLFSYVPNSVCICLCVSLHACISNSDTMIDRELLFDNSMLTMCKHNDIITEGGQSAAIQNMFTEMLEETRISDASWTK